MSTKFIVFKDLKHLATTVTRVYPVQNINFFQYDKANKVFKIQHVSGDWHTINSEGNEIKRNERVFEQLIDNLRDKVIFK
jgi:adenine-specific DNA methylase